MKANFTFSLILFLILLLSFPVISLAQRETLNDRIPKRNPADDRIKRIDSEETKGRDRNKESGSNPIYKERNPPPPKIIVEQPVIIEKPIIIRQPVVEVTPVDRYHPTPPDYNKQEYKKPNYKLEGIAKFNEEDYWGALNDFNIAIDETPEDYELYFHRGKVEIKIKFFEEAKEDLDIFIEYNFYEPEAYFQRGLAKFFLNKRTDALEDFRIAADMDHKLASVIIKRFYN
jgi:tetratricopeptide (TPR) repeat protein